MCLMYTYYVQKLCQSAIFLCKKIGKFTLGTDQIKKAGAIAPTD